MKSIPSFARNENDNLLFQHLKKLVHEEIRSLDTKRLFWVRLKVFLFPLLYISIYAFALQQAKHLFLFYTCFGLMGAIVVMIYLNIIHDAGHNTIFKTKKANSLLLYLLDLLGANSYIWKIKHIKLHHSFPNVAGWDSDMQQHGLIKLFPSDRTRKIHRYQHITIFFLYPLFFFNWLVVRDFKDYFSNNQPLKKIQKIPLREYIKLFLFKSFFFFYTLILPVVFFGFTSLQTAAALMFMLVTAAIIALAGLLTQHVNIKNDFPLVQENGTLESTWFIMQLTTGNNVHTTNWVMRVLLGNFNYHLSHHLFPNISYAYGKEITAVIKAYSKQHDLPYRSFSFTNALKYHYLLVRKNGMQKEFFQEGL